MGFVDFLLGREPKMESNGSGPKFGISVPYEFVQGDAAGNLFSNVRVSRDEALGVPAVLRARNIIAGTLAGLPIHIRDASRQKATPTTLLEQINPDLPNIVTLASTYEDLLFESVSWWRVLNFGWHGYPIEASHVAVERVHASPSGVFIDGLPVPDNQVIRFDSPNPPLLKHAARAIRICRALDATAKLYGDSPMPLGVFTPKAGMGEPNEEQVQVALNAWEQARRTQAWAYVPGALDAKTLQFNAEQIQLADQRQHAVLEIARATGIDPEDLGVSTTSRTYQNAETRRQDTTLLTFGAYINTMEQRLSMRDIIPRGYKAKVNLDAYLRPDTKTRYETHAIGIAAGFETIEEARDLEDRPPLTAAEKAALQPQPQPMEPVNE